VQYIPVKEYLWVFLECVVLLVPLEGKKRPLLFSVAAVLVFRLAVNLPLQERIIISLVL